MTRKEELKRFVRNNIRRTKADAAYFYEKILQCDMDKLDTWQLALAEAVLDVERKLRKEKTKMNHKGLNKITIRAPHGPGKTWAVASIIHLFQFIYNGRVVATAPKAEQLKSRLWPEFRGQRARAVGWYKELISVDATKITFFQDEDRIALAETASEPTNLAGHHREHLLFVVDEASGVNEEMFPVIEGALSTGRIVIVIMIGNPTKNVGTFYDSHMKEKVARNWFKVHVGLRDTKRVSKKWVREMEDKYGKQSPIVQIRCHGNFADMGEDQLINLQWLVDARSRDFAPDGSLPKLRITIDVADGGIDETVITVGEIYARFVHFIGQYAYSFPAAKSPILAAEEAIRIFTAHGGRKSHDDFVVDGLGVGAGTAGYLIKAGHRTVRYVGGADSDNKKKWRNRRVQSYIVARDALRDNEVFIHPSFAEADWDDFTAQICSVLKKPGQDRVEDLLTKHDMKSKGLKSPDRADSYIMMYATQKPTLSSGEDIVGEVIESEFQRRYDANMAI